jgi:hypothetical protein
MLFQGKYELFLRFKLNRLKPQFLGCFNILGAIVGEKNGFRWNPRFS